MAAALLLLQSREDEAAAGDGWGGCLIRDRFRFRFRFSCVFFFQNCSSLVCVVETSIYR